MWYAKPGSLLVRQVTYFAIVLSDHVACFSRKIWQHCSNPNHCKDVSLNFPCAQAAIGRYTWACLAVIACGRCKWECEGGIFCGGCTFPLDHSSIWRCVVLNHCSRTQTTLGLLQRRDTTCDESRPFKSQKKALHNSLIRLNKTFRLRHTYIHSEGWMNKSF